MITALPNPFTCKTEIEIIIKESANDCFFKIYDLLGKEVLREKINSGYNKLIVKSTDIEEGLFIGRVTDGSREAGFLKLIHIKE